MPGARDGSVDAHGHPGAPASAVSTFPVVGVGASAGGLEAFTALFKHLPPNPGMAFVLVQHLDPTHGSMLPELLSSRTAMAVVEATEGTPVAPNTVYVIPAASDVTIEHGVLKLRSRPAFGPHLPIDSFFTSLALDRKSEAVAVVLSGSAADGAAGVQAVKREGGTTLAQDPNTAKYPSMPESAIATGAIDFVFPVPQLARQLASMAGGLEPEASAAEEPVASVFPPEDPLLADLLALVRSVTKADFTHYKRSTVVRRIGRRMMMRHTNNIEGYLQYLREDPAEVQALYQDLLIRVTSFFRQPHTFETLKQKVFPQIAGASAGGQVRFWVPGCSSGEEAYSLAMAWAEFQMAGELRKASFQVFATDINQEVIDRARAGVYPSSIASDVSPERLKRFFSPLDSGYQIAKSIRETCVFAKHDLTRDPPFSRLDLISLRNVLIYLGPMLQRRLMPVLHFALRPGSFLMLGESESVGGFTDLFTLVDKKSKIYAHSGGAAFAQSFPPLLEAREAIVSEPLPLVADYDPSNEADRIVLDSYAPAGVIVDADLQIRRFRGRTGAYLEPGPGRASFDLLRMAREGLAGELTGALREAKEGEAAVHRRGIRILRDDLVVSIGFDVVPMRSPTGEASFLVLFHDAPLRGEEEPDLERLEAGDDSARRVTVVERELVEMREYARAVLEDKESANEELRSANEELQSTNEELQSVNEELETASEEVESTNEELRTLNEELRTVNDRLALLNEALTKKNAELGELNTVLDDRETELRNARDYALAVIDTVREPLLVLDHRARVISASPPFYGVFRTAPNKVLGQSFFRLDERQWDFPELREAMKSALTDGVDFQDFVVDRDLSRIGRRTMLLSGRRIRSDNDGRESILLAIEDVTERARAEVLSDALDQVNLTMISTIDYDELLDRAMTEAARALQCTEAVLAVPVKGSWVVRFSMGVPWASPGLPAPDGQSRQFSALTIGERAVVSTSSKEAGTQVVHVPLRSRDSVVGAISFGRGGNRAAFTEVEMDFIDKLAPALSLALANAELFATEHRIAEVLQTSLLKPILVVPGIEVGLAYRPAHSVERVGGDFYDLFPMGTERVAVVVGDVSGKGVEAASLTETVRATLRTLASLGLRPSSILAKANELLLAQVPNEHFVTVLLAVVDIAGRKVALSSAGHPPVVVCGGDPRFLEAPHGMPLGTMSNGYGEAEFDLSPGETLVLYTDGLIEARRGADFFGEAGLAEALSGKDCVDVQRMVETLVGTVIDYSGGQLADDLAVIAVRLSTVI